ncbi:MAG: ornithine cyclodeaminase family protein [Myxococcota bacterium]|nr:ornithine cyclodeaminase family protein [Myxococcota bacterium]
MTRVLTWPEIESALEGVDLVAAMEEAFVAYSEGRAVVPPVGELILEEPRGEVHIKYGYVKGQPGYVVKIASGFPGNVARGLPPGQGLMLLFDREDGAPSAVLLDEGRLTDLRTAAAGAVAAKHLAPPDVQRIGVLGTGVQARMQLDHLRAVNPCRSVLAWGRDGDRLGALITDLGDMGFEAEAAGEPAQIGEACSLIVTATASHSPLLEEVHPGTHVTAMGSDTHEKQELSARLVGAADLVVVDSRDQAALRGEAARAVAEGSFDLDNALELGDVIGGRGGRTHADQVTIADLTGVAVQDLAIARAAAGI